ncbi:MAG: nitroreductase family protein, partial [Pseudoclavibacter sp.]|nr:nitroreductase family protein [Pseudoclavibacter sp.]
MATQPRNATDRPIHELLADRWSPRGFDPSAELPDEDLRAIFEAVRWTPSANNTQPWKFIVARRGTDGFDRIVDGLMGFNQDWAPAASALVILLTERERDGKPLRWAEYDLGQAAAHLTFQAEALGYRVHQLGGIRADALRTSFEVPESLEIVSGLVLGRHASGEEVPEGIRARDAAQRERKPYDEL